MHKKELTIRVEIDWPEGEQLRYDYTMPRMQYEDSLAPLPRDTSIDIRESVKAYRMLQLREGVINSISKTIASSLFHACSKREKENA